MIDWQLFGLGVIVGVAVAAPIGPINLMAIRNTLSDGFLHGVFTGAGAVLGDGTFAVIAAFGLTAISDLVLGHAVWIQLVGGLVLIGVGLHTMLARPATEDATMRVAAHQRAAALVGTTYVLTVTNPATMMGFIAIFSGMGGLVADPGDYVAAAALVGAVMLGSLLWWVVLAWLASLLRARIAERWLRYVNWAAGAVIVLFGAVVLVSVLWLDGVAATG